MLRRRMRELEDMTAKLYEDKISGAIRMETFQTLMKGMERELHEKAERLEQLTAITSRTEQDTAAIQDWATRIQKYLDLQELDREIIDELIDRIEIGEHVMVDGKRTQAIRVFYRFVGNVEGIIS